jgi:hypothetical protein
LLFQKAAQATTGINSPRRPVNFLRPLSHIAAVKIRTQETRMARRAEQYDDKKEKSPALAGLSDEFHFQSAHFASLAI